MDRFEKSKGSRPRSLNGIREQQDREKGHSPGRRAAGRASESRSWVDSLSTLTVQQETEPCIRLFRGRWAWRGQPQLGEVWSGCLSVWSACQPILFWGHWSLEEANHTPTERAGYMIPEESGGRPGRDPGCVYLACRRDYMATSNGPIQLFLGLYLCLWSSEGFTMVGESVFPLNLLPELVVSN